MNCGKNFVGEIKELALSFQYLFEELIISPNKLIPDNIDSAAEQRFSSFSPPDEAIMNVVCTPALEATSIVSSNDYLENQSRASSGFGPDGSTDLKFKIRGE